MDRLVDYLFFLYFSSHIPLSIVFDSQILLPRWLYPQQILNVVDNYVVTYRDPMLAGRPFWYRAFCVCELLIQLPYCFVASYVFWTGISKCRWARLPMILYSCHVTTTMIPIFFHILLEDFSAEFPAGPRTMKERVTLSMFYLPYLLVPLLLLIDSLFSSIYQQKFPVSQVKQPKSKVQ